MCESCTPFTIQLFLQDGLQRAQRRICIASLYAGVGPGREEQFWDALAATARDKNRPDLRIRVLMDALRATRPCPGPSGSPTSTAELLAKTLLRDQSHHRSSVSLFHSPLLRGIAKRALPPRLREIIGVQHMKGLVFDDDVILTGANLSTSYFTNRQDRYLVVRKSQHLADFFENTINTVAKYSYPLHNSTSSNESAGRTHANGPIPTSDELFGSTPGGVDPVKRAWAFKKYLKKDLESLFALNRRIPWGGMHYAPFWNNNNVQQHTNNIVVATSDWSSSDTWIFPLVQAGFAGVRQEEIVTLRLLRHAARHGGWLHVTTPYLNLGVSYEHALANAGPRLDIQLLTASPEANGFFGSPGLSGSIPLAYSLLERRTWRRLTTRTFELGFFKSRGFKERQLLEYARPGWEYHAKGMYWSPDGGAAAPAVTLIGSSNFGHRSLRRDLECQFLLATSHAGLRAALQREKAALVEQAHVVGPSHFEGPGRTAGVVHRVAVRLLRSFL